MPGVGIINRSPGIFRAGAGLPFPIDGLQHRYDPLITYDSEGTTYMRDLLGDDDVPLVSGTGLDTIYDFSGLNDIRLNKNAYVGNSFGLPEYYNYPYINIYFDTNNPYHWKLPDFHYANLDNQTDITPRLIQDEFFLKAKATSNTSNIIASVSELFIYSAALSGNDLAKAKTYIGIQPDFEGQQVILNNLFENSDHWSLGDYWIISANKLTHSTNNGTEVRQFSILDVDTRYNIEFEVVDYIDGIIGIGGSTISGGIYSTSNGITTANNQVVKTNFLIIYSNGNAAINYISFKPFYQNYYK